MPVTTQQASVPYPIPGTLNITLAVMTYSLALGCLWLASATEFWWLAIICALVFSFVANTIFSLLHESAHGLFHKNKWLNYIFGCVSAAFFPTAFSFQKVCHMGHHQRNRTDAELFDYYTDPKKKFVSYYRLYSLLTGFYWLSIPVGCLLYLLLSPFFHSAIFRDKITRVMGLNPMVEDVIQADALPLRLEIVATVLFQALIIWSLNLSFGAWWLCYIAFALNWSALQYTDHAWSERHITNGAWNLRVHPWIQVIFLNYHCHLVHHRYPDTPWKYLPQRVDPNEPQPSFLSTYLSLWRGPRYTDQPEPKLPDS